MEEMVDLDLRGNKLTAKCFSQLNKIHGKLNKLNLSGNPLYEAVEDKLSVLA